VERLERVELLSSNSHMHLLEASLAWSQLDDDPRWRELADELIDLALSSMIDARTGALPEFFSADWHCQPQWLVDPGHQFEWAWLLLRADSSREDAAIRRAALRLIAIGESHGVHRKRRATITALGSDFTVRDPHARLWSQCERLKAACSALVLTGSAQYEAMAAEAAETLMTYLETPVRGLWRDRLDARGTFIEEPAPASSLYHLVSAILELDVLVDRRPRLRCAATANVDSAEADPVPLARRFADR
jgi:mannose-6-phosphate isomerase